MCAYFTDRGSFGTLQLIVLLLIHFTVSISFDILWFFLVDNLTASGSFCSLTVVEFITLVILVI